MNYLEQIIYVLANSDNEEVSTIIVHNRWK